MSEIIKIPEEKFILDACCGGRMFWFNKRHPNTLYQDIRHKDKGFMKLRPSYEVNPDIQADFRNMPYPDKSFKMVVYDPPHLEQAGPNGWQAQKFGTLTKATWQEDIKKGFEECWRVLDDYGTLIFKWNEEQIKINQVLPLFHTQPLMGHPTSRNGKTKWCVFMKIPKQSPPTLEEQN